MSAEFNRADAEQVRLLSKLRDSRRKMIHIVLADNQGLRTNWQVQA